MGHAWFPLFPKTNLFGSWVANAYSVLCNKEFPTVNTL